MSSFAPLAVIATEVSISLNRSFRNVRPCELLLATQPLSACQDFTVTRLQPRWSSPKLRPGHG
jgi:hypothetical protein